MPALRSVSPRGAANADVLIGLAVLGVAVLAVLGIAFGVTNIVTSTVTCTNTPGPIGIAMSRALLCVKPGTAASFGPSDEEAANFYPVAANTEKCFGMEFRGQYTATNPMSCVAPNGTPVTVYLHEEGVPDLTTTPTDTPVDTPTPTPVNTATPTATPT